LIDADNDFRSGSTQIVASSLTNDTLFFTGVDFNDGDYFTFASSGSAPGGIASGLVLWLDAGKDISLAGSDVTNWLDQSAQGNDAYQDTVVYRPIFVANDVNFNPTLNFNGSTDYIRIPWDNSLILNDISAFWLADVDGGSGTFRAAWTNRDDYMGHISYVDFADKHAYWTGGADTAWYDATSTVSPTSNFELMGLVGSESAGSLDKKLFRQSELIAQQSGTLFVPNTGIDPYIGAGCADCDSPDYHWNGDISEVIWYNRVLDDSSRLQVESYMAIKYGQTLGTISSPKSYLNSDRATVWTGSATYQNNIAGIGRDDKSALSQLKSASQDSSARITLALTDQGGSFATPDAFDTDQEFLIWGHDGADVKLKTTEVQTGFQARLSREWRVQESGTVGSVGLAFSAAGINYNTSDPSNCILILDDDGDFSGGTTSLVIATSISGDTVYFDNVDFNATQYFTLGLISVPAPGGVASNLSLWLKADGTVNTSGSAVTSWDSDAGLFDLDNVSSTPTLEPNVVNFNPTVRFDGVDDKIFNPSVTGSTFLDINDNHWFLTANKQNKD
jgi:hypothetical protein